MADDDLILMSHPDVATLSQPTLRSAYEQVWRHKGWTAVDPAVQSAAITLNRLDFKSLEDLDVQELEQAAAGAGVTVEGKPSKQKLLAALGAAPASDSTGGNG